MTEPNKAFLEENGKVAKVDKIIIYGENAVGKSACAATALIDAPEDRRLIYLMTERNAAGGLEWGLKKHNISVKPGQIIYVYPKAKTKAFANLDRALKAFAVESKKDALKGKADTTQGKENYTYLTNIIGNLMNFTGIDFVTGEEIKIGNISVLTPHDVLFVDGLSPIGKEVWNTTVGDKIAIGQNDYLPAQGLMYAILSELSTIECNVVLYAHERNKTDDNGSLIRTEVNTWVGNSNYSTLMGLFTDIIHAKKEGLNYRWEVNTPKVHANSRRIDNSERNIEPNFAKYGFFTN